MKPTRWILGVLLIGLAICSGSATSQPSPPPYDPFLENDLDWQVFGAVLGDPGFDQACTACFINGACSAQFTPQTVGTTRVYDASFSFGPTASPPSTIEVDYIARDSRRPTPFDSFRFATLTPGTAVSANVQIWDESSLAFLRHVLERYPDSPRPLLRRPGRIEAILAFPSPVPWAPNTKSVILRLTSATSSWYVQLSAEERGGSSYGPLTIN